MADTAYFVNSSWVQYVGTYNDTLYIQFRNGDCALFYNITGANAAQWVQTLRTASRPRGPGTIVNYDFKFSGQAYNKIPSPVGPILNGAVTFHASGAWTATSTLAFIEAWGRGADGVTGLLGSFGSSGGGGAYASSHVNGLVVGQVYAITINNIASFFDAGAEVSAAAADKRLGALAAACTGTTSRFSGGDGALAGPTFSGGGGSAAGTAANGANGVNSYGGTAPPGGGDGGNAFTNGLSPGGGAGGGGGPNNVPAGVGGSGLLRIWPE